MSNISIRGNITAPVEIRYTQNGRAVGNVTVAVNRGRDDNKQTDFYRQPILDLPVNHTTGLKRTMLGKGKP